ncbi:MAG: GNAT family N-acetyltransferase [Alphaproteobacteria bacterium]|nr:GNAT family N-acetyltransferase [Alphaproteobacteria bacterium]MCD8570685.1 GNAT family N-acetyltransferase [Alphaproteobacteria bacterium]
MTQKPLIREAVPEDLSILWGMIHELGAAKDAGYFEHVLERQKKSDLTLYILHADGQAAGYGILNWQPKYGLYRKLEIPEVQDLNVMPAFRRRGFAQNLITHCEELARAKGRTQMGIAVSVHSSFGPAQRLYFKLGYVPDGMGATYDRAAIDFAAFKPVDDQLCLMLVKDL